MAISISKQGWQWLITLAASTASLLLPLPHEYRIFLCITVWAILVWAFDLIQYAIVAVLLPVLYVVFGVAAPETAFSGWLSSSVWITLGGLFFGYAFMSSGLAKRMAYKLLSLTKGSFIGIVAALAGTCFIITPVIPSVMGKIALMVPIAIEVCNALGLQKGDKTAGAIVTVIFFALWSPKMAFMTASTDSILASSVLVSQYHYPITWMSWAADMLLPAVLWTIASISLVFFLRPAKVQLSKEEMSARYANLGSMSGQEKKLAVLMVIVVALLATESLHGIDPTYVLVLVAALCFVPQAGILEAQDFRNVDLSVVFFLAGVVSIGAIASEIGITADAVGLMQPVLEGQSGFFFVMALYLFSVFANFLLNPMALIATLLGPMTELCSHLGYSPVLGAYAMIMGFNQALFPYQMAPYMLVYSYGYMEMKSTVKVMGIRIAAGIVFTAAITYPYWCLVGLV